MTEKILFVDDEVHILNAMKRQLRKRFDVATAESGKEALEKFKTEDPFAVVVADMRMPVMDGIQLLSYIKDLSPDTVKGSINLQSELLSNSPYPTCGS